MNLVLPRPRPNPRPGGGEVESAGTWEDQRIRETNERAGWELCEHCEGTGNELLYMYRVCSSCGGSGQVGEPPFKVRLSRWLRFKRARFAQTNWRTLLRWWASYYLGLGHWFHDRRDRCRHCDATPSDIDFEMVRLGPRRAVCADVDMCHTTQEEERDD